MYSDTAPIENEQRIVDALKACGGMLSLLFIKGWIYNAWDPTYNNPEVYSWLLQHPKGKNSK